MVGRVPDAVEVLRLAPPDVGAVQGRLEQTFGTVAELAGVDRERPQVTTGRDRTTLRFRKARMRATGFHASGAMSVDLGVRPFDDVFDADPGDEKLTELCEEVGERLGLRKALPSSDSLSFERLWRIKAAGGDAKGTVTDPVLCRAVGAFRHSVGELPVYGRASATVEVANAGRLVSMSISARRFAGDESGETIARTLIRSPEAAANEVAERMVKAFEGAEELKATLQPQWFRFGYLSLGRRSTQDMLAPFYVAAISVRHEEESSAHVIAVSGGDDQFMRLPTGRRSSALTR